MNAYLTATARYFGFPALTLRLGRRSRQRLLWVSLLPMIIVSANLIQIALSFAFDQLGGFFTDSSEVPEFWMRLFFVSQALDAALTPLALAALFAAGIQAWSRAEGSWMFLIGVTLAAAALGLGTTSAFMYGALSSNDVYTLRAPTWTFLANPLAFLSIGYFFVAFRSIPAGPAQRNPRPFGSFRARRRSGP